MGAPFGSRRTGPRTADEGRELALDLTADEVVLYEGSARGGWRRFAGVALDDPEFLEVIGLLRAEAEAAIGGSRPVRLWLPAEQVLAVAMPVAEVDPETDRESDPEARLRAAFARIGDETGRDPDEVAIALPPAGAAGGTLLVTYADTLHEARDYAARWGFVPGLVSTRHHAEAFAPAEPVFRLRSTVEKRAPAARPAAAWPAIGLACLVGALAAALAPALAPWPADASQAPGQTPLPMARAGDPGAGQPAPGMAIGPTVLAILPPSREAGDGDTMSAPPPGPAAPAAAAPPPADPSAAGEAEPGGLAAPLPPARPVRPMGLGASISALPAIGASAPPPVRGAAAEVGLPQGRVSLIGILNLETGREALLRLPDGGFRSVRVGDVLDGWRVSAIGVDAMRVRRGAEERTLLLVTR